MRRLSRLGLRRTKRRPPGEYPTEGDAERQGPLPGASRRMAGRRRLRAGEWLDPRRGQVPLSVVADMWLESRRTVKRRTLESDRGAWRNYIAPRFGRRPVASITSLRWGELAGLQVGDRVMVPDPGVRLSRAVLASQRVLGHATAAMTMDLYGHMIDRNLWDAAQRLGGTTGARPDDGWDDEGGALAKSHD
jgi:hypothetical protein